MKNCLLCDNFGRYCTCEHCENYDNFRLSKKGKSLINQVRKDMAKEIYSEIDDSDILTVETEDYGEIDVVSIERLKEIVKSKGVEVK